MKNKDNHKLTIGILAHVDAGKTTLSEDILYLNGSIKNLGRVDYGDAFLDMHSLERERGITIFSKQALFSLGNKMVTLLDTPGHVDFSAEMERTLQILDYAILVISGPDGIQNHVQTLWKLLNLYKIPVFLFVNKMDRLETNKSTLLEELIRKLGDSCIDFSNDPSVVSEKIALCDEKILESYLVEGTVSTSDIVERIAQRKIFPVFFGSALKVTGVEELLTGLNQYTRCPIYSDQFAARVFKITRDHQGNRLTHLKVTGGMLRSKTLLSGESWEEKVDQIRIYSGSQFQMENSIEAGTVCAVTGLTKSFAGEGLGVEQGNIKPILDTVLTYQLILPPDIDGRQVFLKLKLLEEEMPELHLEWKEKTREIQVDIMGDVQIEILKHLIKSRFNVNADVGLGSIVYKETIENTVEGVGHFEPLRHYAEVHLLMEPLPQGSGLICDVNCNEDVFDQHWQNLVLSHLKERHHPGILTGSTITDMKITVMAGQAHKKHTVGGDFRQATYRAVRQGLKKAKPVLLEPYYEYRLEVPTSMIGRAMSDIQQMWGTMSLPETINDMTYVTGVAPVATIGTYQREVNSYTQGTGQLFYSLSGFGPCHNTAEVVESIGYDPEGDILNPTGSVFCQNGVGVSVPWNNVDEYMHLESCLKPIHRDVNFPPHHSTKTNIYDEKDLEAIFYRTYGESKRKRNSLKKEGKVITPTSSPTKTKPPKPNGFNNKDAEEILIIDGYNIIFSWNELNELSKVNLETARNRLIEILTNYQGYTGMRIMVVFDAYKRVGNPGTAERVHEIDIIYTKDGVTADQFIEKTVHQLVSDFKITVATSDGLEQLMIFGQGALRMSARELKEQIDAVNLEMRRKYL